MSKTQNPRSSASLLIFPLSVIFYSCWWVDKSFDMCECICRYSSYFHSCKKACGFQYWFVVRQTISYDVRLFRNGVWLKPLYSVIYGCVCVCAHMCIRVIMCVLVCAHECVWGGYYPVVFSLVLLFLYVISVNKWNRINFVKLLYEVAVNFRWAFI